MSSGIISILVAVGAATWIYTKFMKYSGNNTQQSLISAVISGIIIFFVIFMVLGMLS